ncbi:DUF4825 domain-containing protein [Caldibacillus lycopersici]|uniref:DUF4825 domain-containing protein n=1 Tax=Perspicuibacillus lycopersici TaxID=1325689 RepID=A0AAE3IXW8_9BACI|nr:DUF4825 domain-containing protein [Perspicuibacillus lycopersici]MCU9614954.1 DUF4825 domain-containing protein [Perspicuibacillus lycopersici]
MTKIKIAVYLLFSFMSLLVLNGCHANNTKMDLFQYKDSYVGDNSAVINIANHLQGANHLTSIELETKQEPYGIKLLYDWNQSDVKEREIVLYNATYLFSLIQNVDWITFSFSSGVEYTITKENLQQGYGKDVSKIDKEDELAKLLQKTLEDEKRFDQFFP